ncbi:MAG: ABC transporter permease [Candidatus Hadarchaeum sp.]|uniref:ABC transporter permease n=1 Tax=Candidatus Hadarchaeum sp. TaxID=2883567 RepID=UPI00316EE450
MLSDNTFPSNIQLVLKRMAAYVVRRLLSMFPILLGAVTFTFFLMRLVPGDPVLVMLGPDASPEAAEQLRHSMGLDKPIFIQYLLFITRVSQGDLGVSIAFHEPVVNVIKQRLEVSSFLALGSGLIILFLGVGLGILAAARAGSWVDQLVLMLAVIGVAVPSFWLGLMLMLVFAVRLNLLPSSGFVSIIKTGNVGNVKYLILPSFVLGFVNSALVARLTRASMLEVLQEDFIRAAFAKGLPSSTVLLRHTLRNAAIPVLTVFTFTLAGIFSGAVVTETVFALPGIGRLVVEAILKRDYPVIQGLMLLVAGAYLLVNLLTDIFYALIDPRLRLC